MNCFIHLCLQEDDFADWIKWPNADYVKNFKKKKREFGDYPSPDDCILEMVNFQLKVCTICSRKCNVHKEFH